MIKLKSIGQYPFKAQTDITWNLLQERPAAANISHDGKTRRADHNAFVAHHPYRHWLLIENDDGEVVGALTLTLRNEIGIAILQAQTGKGYAKAAVAEALRTIPPLPAERSNRPGHYVANVAPGNAASVRLFKGLGGKLIQQTFQL